MLAQNTSVVVRAKAQMLRTGGSPTWNFSVKNNTYGNALFALERPLTTSTVDVQHDLTAGTGWGGSAYTGTRAAAPFAILDTVYQAKQLLHSAAALNLPALNLYWSPNNRPADPLCPSDGTIGTTFYSSGGENDDCAQPRPFLEGIYVLGNFEAGDTDEFDQHVIAHEFAHYIEWQLSRSDSIGGVHNDGDRLDLRVAFGEGWANAFAGMVLNSPVYRDSYSGVTRDFSFDLEQDNTNYADGGWFSEASVGEILWDLFDSTNEPGDSVALGFALLFGVMTSDQRTTDALTSIFTFLTALRADVPGSSAGINDLRNGEQISGTDEFGTGETNHGGDTSNLPIYRPIALNQPQQAVCVRAMNGVNKLGYSRFFRLDLATTARVTIAATGAVDSNTSTGRAAFDPDIYVYRRGEEVAKGTATGPSETITQQPLAAGTYIIEVLDYALTSGSVPACMTLSVAGN